MHFCEHSYHFRVLRIMGKIPAVTFFSLIIIIITIIIIIFINDNKIILFDLCIRPAVKFLQCTVISRLSREWPGH